MALTDKLTNIANAIREKTGSTEPMTLDDMADKILSIQTSSSGGGGYDSGGDFDPMPPNRN